MGLAQFVADGAPGAIGADQRLELGPFLAERGIALIVAAGNGQFLLEALVATDDGFEFVPHGCQTQETPT